MLFHGFAKVALRLPDSTEQYVRELPFGSIDGATDDASEFAERMGVDTDITGKLSKLVKSAQLVPLAPRSVNLGTTSDGAFVVILVHVAINGSLTSLNYGKLDFDRDSAAEIKMREGAAEAFRSELSEILALAAAHPSLQIYTGLHWVTPKGGNP